MPKLTIATTKSKHKKKRRAESLLIQDTFKGLLYTEKEGGYFKEYRCTDRVAREILNRVCETRSKELSTREASQLFHEHPEKIQPTIFPDSSKRTVFYCRLKTGQDFDFIFGMSRRMYIKLQNQGR